MNPHDPKHYALNIMQDGITLPDPKWYYSGTADAKVKLRGFKKVIKKVLSMCGEDESDSVYDADAVIAVESAMARLFEDAEHERTHQQTQFSLSEVDGLVPNLHLSKVLERLSGGMDLSKTPILVRNPEYLRGLNKLLVSTPASHLRSYMLFRMAFILGADMGQEWLNVGQELQEVVVGQRQMVPRWYKCFHSVNNALPDYVGKVAMPPLSSRPFSPMTSATLWRLLMRIGACIRRLAASGIKLINPPP